MSVTAANAASVTSASWQKSVVTAGLDVQRGVGTYYLTASTGPLSATAWRSIKIAGEWSRSLGKTQV